MIQGPGSIFQAQYIFKHSVRILSVQELPVTSSLHAELHGTPAFSVCGPQKYCEWQS